MQNLVLTKIAYLIELLSLIVGIFMLFKHKDIIIRLLSLYLILNVGLETVFLFIYQVENNIKYHNTLTLVNFTLFFILFYKSLDKERNKKIVVTGAVTYYLTFILSIVFYNNYLIESTSLANIIGTIILAVFIMLYYFEVLYSEKVLYIKRDVFFWFTVGALLYYTGNIPFELMINFNLSAYTSIFYINYLLCIIFYSCFILGFLLHKSRRIL